MHQVRGFFVQFKASFSENTFISKRNWYRHKITLIETILNQLVCMYMFSCPCQHDVKTRDDTAPHELAEGFVVGEFPVVLLCEGMINILQTPLLRQLGRRLLLYRLLRTNHQSEQEDNGLVIEIF